MTINIISDIHASVNEKTKKVVYNLPNRFSIKKYSEALKELDNFWKNNLKKNYSFDKCIRSKFFNKHETAPLQNKTDVENLIKDIRDNFKNKFSTLSIEETLELSYGIMNLSELFYVNEIKWSSSNKIALFDIRDYVLKCIGDFDPKKLLPADYLIIAGDLGYDNTYDIILNDIKEKTKGKFKKILHIAGNHDHWWVGFRSWNQKCPSKTNFSHDYFEYVDGDYAFLGCTLWTPIDDNHVYTIGRCMNDYNYSPNFSPYMSREQYKEQSSWLKERLEEYKDKKVVVFTHHQPFIELTHEDFKHNGRGFDSVDLNQAYCVSDHSLDDINKYKNIVLWACGHTHKNYDGILHDVHVVRNPIGYRDEYGFIPAENLTETWYNKIVEV